MNPRLTLSGDFENPDLSSLCDELKDLPDWQPGTSAQIDFRQLTNIGPTALAVLLASLRGLHRQRICNPLDNFDPPQGRGLECLRRETLLGFLADECGHWQEVGEETPAILGCETFAGEEGIDRVTGSLLHRLELHTEWTAPSLRLLRNMVFGMTENVLQHSHAKCGVAVAQIVPTERRVVLAVADNGIGVRQSLAHNPRFSDIEDDRTAVIKAMAPGTTAEPGTGGGMGLYLARCLVRENEGKFVLRSGGACREETDEAIDRTDLPPLNGTLISADLRSDRPLDNARIESTLDLPGAGGDAGSD